MVILAVLIWPWCEVLNRWSCSAEPLHQEPAERSPEKCLHVPPHHERRNISGMIYTFKGMNQYQLYPNMVVVHMPTVRLISLVITVDVHQGALDPRPYLLIFVAESGQENVISEAHVSIHKMSWSTMVNHNHHQ